MGPPLGVAGDVWGGRLCLCPCSLRTSAWSPTPRPEGSTQRAWVPPELRAHGRQEKRPIVAPEGGWEQDCQVSWFLLGLRSCPRGALF